MDVFFKGGGHHPHLDFGELMGVCPVVVSHTGSYNTMYECVLPADEIPLTTAAYVDSRSFV